MNVYETEELLGQYLAFHYGDSYFGVGNYPARCASLCLELLAGLPKQRGLDLGCAVGRTTFELGRVFGQVDGVDLSRSFIEAANGLRETGQAGYLLREQGEIGEQKQVSLSDLRLAEAARRTRFHQADACALAPEFAGYDLIFAGNLIDRLQEPRAFLADVHTRLNVGGLLVISSPYTLLEEFTPRAHWLGGFQRHGKPYRVLDGMNEILAPHFELVQAPVDVPFVIRETARKFQHSVAELSAWKRTL